MAANSEEGFIFWIEIITIGVFSILLFEYGIQPVLVSIDPMFSWQHSVGDIAGKMPDNPAGVSLWITGITLYLLYGWAKYRTDVYITGER